MEEGVQNVLVWVGVIALFVVAVALRVTVGNLLLVAAGGLVLIWVWCIALAIMARGVHKGGA